MANLTLEDIAKIAGVSRATVSRVINHHPNVRQNLRERVQGIIDETGYQPNLAARSLVSQETKLIGLVIPRGVHGFLPIPIFQDLWREFRRHAINMVTLSPSHYFIMIKKSASFSQR